MASGRDSETACRSSEPGAAFALLPADMKDDLYSAICREALESRQRDVMSFVDNGMAGMSSRLEKTLLRLPSGHYLLGLGPYNAGLVKLDFEELLIGREVPEFIGVGMPVSGFRVSSPDAFLNVEVSRLHAKVIDVCGLPPRDVMCVQPGSLPKTSSGKLQRSLCRERYLNEELALL